LLAALAALAVAATGYCAEPLRVHVVRGSSYYTRDYKVDELLSHAGASLLTESTESDRGVSQWGGTSAPDAGWLRGYPDPAAYAMEHRLVVVCSVGASGFGKNQQVLIDFVKQGGAVLFFCDSYTFGDRSGKSPLAELAPLEFPAEGPWRLETQQVSEGVELKPGPDSTLKQLPDVEQDNPPRVYSYYQVKPKSGAKVLLVAGDDQPILLMHEFGKGRVALFTATCRGYPKEGQVAYWRWSGWPAILVDTVKQITATSRTAAPGLDEETRQAIVAARNRAYDLLDGANEAGRADFEASLRQTATRCHDKSTAEFVMELIAKYSLDLPIELATAIGDAVGPSADESLAEYARTLIDSGKVGKTILGLIVLGGTRSGDARPTLEEFYASGAPRKAAGTEDSLLTADSLGVAAFMQTREDAVQIRRAAVTGLGLLADQAAVPLLSKAVATHAAEGRYQAETTPEGIEAEHRDYQNALMASLFCGDAQAAGPVVDALLGNLSVISRSDLEAEQRQSAVAWQRQLYRRLTAVPENVLPALAKRVAAEQNSGVTVAALAMFGGKQLAPEIATVLSASPVPAVAALGKRLMKKEGE
jgi:hypothetical protein